MTIPSFLNKQFLPMVWNWTSQSIGKSSNTQSTGKSITVINNVCLFKLAEKVTLSTGLFYEHLSSTSSLDHPYVLHNGNFAVLFSPFTQTHWTPVMQFWVYHCRFTVHFWISTQMVTALFGCYTAGAMWNCYHLPACSVDTIQLCTYLQSLYSKPHM